ncbi:MAG TPA: response regulator [Bryobacteraceae bacterium]|jgi:CheY-like chemotaxis protein
MTRSQPHVDPKQILIVDDNKMGLSARRALLEAVGHVITTAACGADALKVVDGGGAFDLVVTDYKMPNMNGVELIAELRVRNPVLPIILISGFTDTLGLNEDNTQADVVLQKSSNEVTQLMRAVSKLLNKAPGRKPPGAASRTAVIPKRRQQN